MEEKWKIRLIWTVAILVASVVISGMLLLMYSIATAPPIQLFIEGNVVRVAHPIVTNRTRTTIHFEDGRVEQFPDYTDIPLGNVTIVYQLMGKQIVEIHHEDYEVIGSSTRYTPQRNVDKGSR